MNADDKDMLEQKGEALMRGLLQDCGGDVMDAIKRLALAMAWLTSTHAKHREIAKSRVRDWVKAGSVSQAKP
jgi:hypothetical protein